MKYKTLSVFSSALNSVLESNRADFIKDPKKHFTRNRTINLTNLILLLINSSKETLKDVLSNYYSHLGIASPTPSALSHAKKKIKHEGLNMLAEALASDLLITNKNNLNLYKGKYMLMAIDGSKMTVPTRIDNFEDFIECNHRGEAVTRQVMISELYDPLNEIPLAISISKRNDEHTLAKELIKKAYKIAPDYQKNFVFDRYYPSLEIIHYIEEIGACYVMRLNRRHFKNLYNPIGETGEETAETSPPKAWCVKHKEIVEERKGKKFKIRFAWFKISPKEKEVTITNLPEDVTIDNLKELYWHRWGVETDYRHSKQRTHMDFFSGRRQEIVFQDIYSSFISHMLTAFIILECRKKVKKKTKKFKHKMKSNHANAVRTIRQTGILILVYFKLKGCLKVLEEVYIDIISTIIPIRPGRQYPRSIKGTSKGDVYKF